MSLPKNIAYYALTSQGLNLAWKLANKLGGKVHVIRRLADQGAVPFDSLSGLVGDNFHAYDAHVFVAASGIVVRCIAKHLQGKDVDPAVICLDQEGRHAISLLSGHLGGANELAVRCARIVGGQPVITTATDTAGIVSMDMLAASKGLVIGNIDRIKVVNSALLEGATVQVYDPIGQLGAKGDRFVAVLAPQDWKSGEPGVWVSCREDCPDDGALRLYPRLLHLGIGCRRDIPRDEIIEHVTTVFAKHKLSMNSIASVGSVEAKRNETGLIEAAHHFGVEPVFYTTKELAAVKTPTPSHVVHIHMGVPSVAEASAMLSAGRGDLVVTKEKTQTVTLAVARWRNA